jgi:hypothetical protein
MDNSYFLHYVWGDHKHCHIGLMVCYFHIVDALTIHAHLAI